MKKETEKQINEAVKITTALVTLIKPCPFCGEKPVLKLSGGVHVECEYCKCPAEPVGRWHPLSVGGIFDAIDEWNERGGKLDRSCRRNVEEMLEEDSYGYRAEDALEKEADDGNR